MANDRISKASSDEFYRGVGNGNVGLLTNLAGFLYGYYGIGRRR